MIRSTEIRSMRTKLSCAIRHLQFAFLNRSMRFPVCGLSARFRQVRDCQPVRTRPWVLERVCSIKPGKRNPKRRARKTQIRLRRNPVFSERCAAFSGPAMCDSPRPDPSPVRVIRHRFYGYCPAAFNSQADEFLVGWDQLVNHNWAVYDQRLSVDGMLLGENNPIIQPDPDTFIESAVAYNADTNQYFITWRFQGGAPGSKGFNNAFGRLVDTSGNPAGDVVHVSNAGLEETLVFNSVTGEFFHHARDLRRRRNSRNLPPANRWRWHTARVADTDHHGRSARSSR